MTDQETRLYEFLSKYGEPTNIFVSDSVLTFCLVKPTFETNMTMVLNFQKELLEYFPEFNILKKVQNNTEQFWTVLLKEN